MPTKNPSSNIIALSTASAASPAPSTVPADRESGVRIASLLQFEERAERELPGYFARLRSGAPAHAKDADIAAVFATIPVHHRGALSLRNNGREWPAAVKKAFGRCASLGVRLYCVDHPSVGPTSVVENAAAECVAAAVAASETDKGAARMLDDLSDHAEWIYARAIRAYAKAARRRAKARG